MENVLELKHVTFDDKVRKMWNIHMNDYYHLIRNRELISNTLYRVGGFGVDLKADYFILLKYTEAYYDDTITKDKDRKPHLKNQWCILDKNGVERVIFKSFENPYLVKDSQIYTINNKYYNIETGEFYCYALKEMESTEYLFLNSQFDENKSRRGVMKINKKDGTWELFK
jgi:hypothetical protein